MPIRLAEDVDALLQIRRFSFVRDSRTKTGSRLALRRSAPRIVEIDLTFDRAPAAR